MKHTVLIIVVGVLLTACVSESVATSTAIPPSDTPLPTSTNTPSQSPTPTRTPTPVPTPTATESPPPLLDGAQNVQKEGSVWAAYDGEGARVAMWLPDPDTQNSGWMQRYAKNDGGEIFAWNTKTAEWDGVPKPEGVVYGWADLEEGGETPVWKIDVSPLQIQDDVVIGEFTNGKWELVPFEIILPDEDIVKIHRRYIYEGNSPIDVWQSYNDTLIGAIHYNVVMLGLKYEEGKNNEKVMYVLVGGKDGITKSQVDLVSVDDGSVVKPNRTNDGYNHIFIPDADPGDMSLIVKDFVISSEDVHKEGSVYKPLPEIILGIYTTKEGADIQEGCGSILSPEFGDACIKSLENVNTERPVNAQALALDVSKYWIVPNKSFIGGNWWDAAPEMPDSYFGWLSINE